MKFFLNLTVICVVSFKFSIATQENTTMLPKNGDSEVITEINTNNLKCDDKKKVTINDFFEKIKTSEISEIEAQSLLDELIYQKPQLIAVSFEAGHLNVDKKKIPIVSRKFISILARDIEKKLKDKSVPLVERINLFESFRTELLDLEKTQIFDPINHKSLRQILIEKFITQVNTAFLRNTLSLIYDYIPIIERFNLATITVQSPVGEKGFSITSGMPLSVVSSAMTKPLFCKMSEKLGFNLDLNTSNEYAKLRKKAYAESFSGGQYSSQSPGVELLDKSLLPLALDATCNAIAAASAPLLCKFMGSSDPVFVATTQFATATFLQTATSYAVEKQGIIRSGSEYSYKVLSIGLGAFRVGTTGLSNFIGKLKTIINDEIQQSVDADKITPF